LALLRFLPDKSFQFRALKSARSNRNNAFLPAGGIERVIAGTIAMAFRDSAARKSLGMAEAEHFGSDHSVELSAIDHGPD